MAKKNGNGEGSRPRQRADGRWEARYCIKTLDGPKRRSVYGKTRKDVADRLAEAIASKDHAPVPTHSGEGITVGESLIFPTPTSLLVRRFLHIRCCTQMLRPRPCCPW